jgi:hypothetical protein
MLAVRIRRAGRRRAQPAPGRWRFVDFNVTSAMNCRLVSFQPSTSNLLEVRDVDGRLYVSRKAKKPDEWDPPIPAYDPYGPGTGVAGDVDFVAGDETSVAGDAGA